MQPVAGRDAATHLWQRLGLRIPLIQAPMAGVSTPALAAAVSDAGGLGSIAVGATDAPGARTMIAALRAATGAAFNVNVFVHATPRVDTVREAAWCTALAPQFAAFGVQPPEELATIYRSFADDAAMQALLVELAPPMVSFHFGLPAGDVLAALRGAGCVLAATATNVAEARAIADAGLDLIIAQGWEAGGHRGMFDPAAPDARLATRDLVHAVRRETALPVVAAGGIMTGQGIHAAMADGAMAAQLGTAFVACPEGSARPGYRAALLAARDTVMTSAISGRPARCLANRFTALGNLPPVPDYPRAYAAGKALDAAAQAHGEDGFGAQWAGSGVTQARAMPAADLVAQLLREMAQA